MPPLSKNCLPPWQTCGCRQFQIERRSVVQGALQHIQSEKAAGFTDVLIAQLPGPGLHAHAEFLKTAARNAG